MGAHSKKDGAEGQYKGGYGFHPMLAYLDQTGEGSRQGFGPVAPAPTTRRTRSWCSGRARATPGRHIETLKILPRVDSAGATHELIDWARDGQIRLLGRL
jgi:hypothetical protein